VWAGVVPLGLRASAVEPADDLPVPDDVRRRLADWGAPSPG
jgi:hypothetical protein